MTVATVLVPTHTHGRLLEYAVASALAQTVYDLKVFVVCDGATDETVEVARNLERRDSRVLVFENVKGARHGEAHRHRALKEATSRIVCYLSDDDLWLPNHVELLLDRLQEVEFAFTAPSYIDPTGQVCPFSIPKPEERAAHFSAGLNFIPLSVVAHTLAAYRRLREGWAPAPENVYTDINMWRKFTDIGICPEPVPVSTACVFPESFRRDWTPERRLLELGTWWSLIQKRPEDVRRVLTDGARLPS